MRLMKPLELDRISQVLAKGSCPICAFVKNDQAALLRGELQPDRVTDLCNFHAWALAAAVDRDKVARIFLQVLTRQMSRPPVSSVGQCSVCSQLVQQEVIHIQELIAQLEAGGLVLDWIKRQGTFCLSHANHLRELAPSRLHPVIDEIMDRSAKALATNLENLLLRTEAGKGTGGGALGRAAEFLASQRGINR
jgi:hypothetical protein